MIGRVVRGWRTHGLIAYLFGPGRHHEHTDPHVVASWDDCPDLHQPAVDAAGRFDVADLVATLTAPAAAAGVPQRAPTASDGQRVPQGPVWHCSLRTAPGDPELSDGQWAEIVADLVERVGIGGAGDPGGCRWVAVRHATDHVHVAAVLVRQDTLRRVHPRRDYHRVRDTCLAAEHRYGLTGTQPADRTTHPRPSRGEVEKAGRDGRGASRDWLRDRVRTAAALATNPEEFVQLLDAAQVRVRVRRDQTGRMCGYAVAHPLDRPTRESGPQELVWFGGRRLAPDLTAPALTQRWATTTPPDTDTPGDGRVVWSAAAATLERARATLADGEEGAGIAHTTGDLLLVLAAHPGATHLTAGLRQAAGEFARAARDPGQGQPDRWGSVARDLRAVSRQLARARPLRARSSITGAVEVLALLVAVTRLVAEIAAWREHRHHTAGAAAAHRTHHTLTQCVTEQRIFAEPPRPTTGRTPGLAFSRGRVDHQPAPRPGSRRGR